jgi:anti-sigma B factor antagonist
VPVGPSEEIAAVPEPAAREFAVTSGARSATRITVVIRGDFDLSGVGAFTDEVERHVDDGVTRLDIDASELSFADSSALKALVTAKRDAAAAGATLHVVAMSEALDRVVDMTGLRQVLCTEPA